MTGRRTVSGVHVVAATENTQLARAASEVARVMRKCGESPIEDPPADQVGRRLAPDPVVVVALSLESERVIYRCHAQEKEIASVGCGSRDTLAQSIRPSTQLVVFRAFDALNGTEAVAECLELRAVFGQHILYFAVTDDPSEREQALEVGVSSALPASASARERLANFDSLLRTITRVFEKALGFGVVEVDVVRRLVTVAGKPCHVTPLQYELLVYLLRGVGVPQHYDDIAVHLGGSPDRRATQKLADELRDALKAVDKKFGDIIETARGVGYGIGLTARGSGEYAFDPTTGVRRRRS